MFKALLPRMQFLFDNFSRIVPGDQTIFIAGLPKSGTTWLMSLMAEIPGVTTYTPDHVTMSDHNLKQNTFKDLRDQRVVIKLHTPATNENLQILRENQIKTCVIYRDLRDIAVSWVFYVRNVRLDHPMHKLISNMTFDDGLLNFIVNKDATRANLTGYINWVELWIRNRDTMPVHFIKYEDLKRDPENQLKLILDFFGYRINNSVVRSIIKARDFKKISGRKPGSEDKNSFVRKGIIGDWKNYFSDCHKEAFKEFSHGFLIRHGYELNNEW